MAKEKDLPHKWAKRIHPHSKENEVQEQVRKLRKSKVGTIDTTLDKLKPKKFPKLKLGSK